MRWRDTVAQTPLAVVLIFLLAAGLLLAGLHTAVTADMRARLLGEVRTDIVAAGAADRVLPAITALTVLDRQSIRGGGGGPLYILIDPETRRPLAGNLAAWPSVAFDAQGCGTAAPAATTPAMIACTTHLDGHFPLLIARSTDTIGSVGDRMLAAYALLAIVVTLAAGLTGWLRLSRLQTRLTPIRAALAAFASGDLAARPPDGRGDVLGRLSGDVGATLNRLELAINGQHVIAERIAHDMKRPVAVALKTFDLDRTDDEILSACRGHLADLNEIIDTILWVGAITEHDAATGSVAVDAVAREMIALYHDAAKARGVTIESDLQPAMLTIRAGLIDRLIANLLSNAVKYTAADSVVHVSVRSDTTGITINVADQGPGKVGLPAQPGTYFARGSAAENVEGLGLGLTLVRRIVELAHGSLNFEERTDTPGLSVIVRLPNRIGATS